jgi:PAT family beta-lactamase induction signal transducer AmpG
VRAFCWLTAYERDSQTFAIITAIVLGSMGFGVFGVRSIKMTPQELSSRSHPVVFLFLFLPWGILTGYLGVTVSYLLAQAGMSAEQIAGLIALGFIPQTWKFLWAPLVDTTLSQRKWYVLAAFVTSVGIFGLGALPASQLSLP